MNSACFLFSSTRGMISSRLAQAYQAASCARNAESLLLYSTLPHSTNQLRGAAAQAAVLAELIGADDPNPDATQLLAAQLRDAMERQIEEELRRLADLKAELARLAAQTGAELDGPGAS
jgi:hypothetical protein